MLASLRSTAALLLGVLVCSVPIWGQVRPLPAKAIDIEYSSSLDRLVLISKAPDQLLIVDPATSLTGVVALPKEPLSLSVSPDGKYAAVGHDALISYINLSTAVTDKYLLVSVKTTEILLAANGWVHAFALDSYSSRSVNLSTGAETALDTLHWVSHPAIHPNGRWVYSTRDGLSPNDIHKGDISSGPYKRLYDSRYHGQFNMCGRIWFTKDGQRLFNSCSTLFRVSADQNSDLLYNGRFSAAVKGIQGGAHAATLGRIIVAAGGDLGPHTTATEIQFYDDKFLNHIGSFFLPGGWSGRQLFTDAAESRLYIVATDAAGNSGIYTVSLTPGATCNSTLGQNAANSPADGGDVTVNVVASAGCVWQSSTNEPWINITNGGVAAGNASVKLTASPNLSASPRSGSVTIAGRTYTVTQAAATATPVSPITSLALRPVAAEYSKALDAVVMVSGYPNKLTVFVPATRTEVHVPLALEPTSLAISPDGLRAAVGHNGWVSYVNLQTGAVEKNLPVSADASRVALSATHVYVFPFSTGWDSVKILSLATGVETAWNINLNGSAGGRVTPDGRYLYIGGVLRYDVLNKTPETNPGYFSVSCSDLWFTQDASRIFTSCGEFRRSTEGSNTEPVYGGRLFERGTAWATHSAARKLVAAVPVPAQPGYNQAPEPAKISLFSDDYLTAVGSLDVPKMPAGAQQVAAHARWLFWSNSADRLYAIVQADEASGLLFDYALYTVSFDTSCGVTLGAASASVGLGGGTGTLAVSATAGCVWHATSSAPWLIVARNGVATGSTAVSYIVEPNTTAVARTATITIGGQTFTMAQPAGSPAGAGPTRVLPFRVTDAEYSLALDRIVAVSPSPDTLSIYDPLTLIRTVVALPRPPTALTLSIDGLSAAVGHDGLISIVNLQTAVVEKTVAVSIKVFDLALAPNGWVHASASGGWGTAVSMNTATGAETKVDLLYRGEYFRIHPHGGALYSAEGGGTTARWGIEDGPLRFEWQKSDPPLCGPMWFLADARLVGRCRNVLRTASTSNDDLKYAGKLSGSTGGIVAATHSPERRTLAAVATVDLWSLEATEVTLHDDEFLALTGRITLPNFPVPGQTISSNGKHLFWSKDGARLYAVMQAESGALLNDYALHIISPEYNASTCTFTLSAASAQASASGLNGSIAVTSAASCVWQAKSNAAWITLNTGQFGAGPGTVNFAVGPNLTASSRSGTITAGGQTFTVTQAAGDASTFCSGNISNPTLIAGAKGGSGTLDLTIGPNCSWTASAGSSWSHVLPISGSGSSSFGYTIYPNFGTKPRSTTLTIAGRTVTITQAAGTGAPDERFIGLMYFNFLGRLATPSEVAFHVKHLQSHGKREQAVLAFWNAEEFALGGRFVAGLYVGLLGRDAEFEGWLFNRNAVVGGIVSQAMLAPAFLNSPEFAAKHGLLDNGAFVRMLYRQALNREAQDWEVQQHSETLRKGMKRDVMAQNFLNSAEFRLGVDKRLTSFLLYSTLLLRSIHPQEMAARVSQLEQGVTIGQMVAGILVSNEFTRLLE